MIVIFSLSLFFVPAGSSLASDWIHTGNYDGWDIYADVDSAWYSPSRKKGGVIYKGIYKDKSSYSQVVNFDYITWKTDILTKWYDSAGKYQSTSRNSINVKEENTAAAMIYAGMLFVRDNARRVN